MLGQVDFAHPPFAELPEELVLAEPLRRVKFGAKAVEDHGTVDSHPRPEHEEHRVRAVVFDRAEFRVGAGHFRPRPPARRPPGLGPAPSLLPPWQRSSGCSG